LSGAVPLSAVQGSRIGVRRAFADALYRRPRLLLALLLGPPLAWLGIVYVGSLMALLVQSVFALDQFTGLIVYRPTLATYAELLSPPIWTSSCAACSWRRWSQLPRR
jgi:putative spermidine/putrescine transport system permease protein